MHARVNRKIENQVFLHVSKPVLHPLVHNKCQISSIMFNVGSSHEAYKSKVKYGVFLGSCVQLYSLAETPHPPPPHLGSYIRGRCYWSAKIDDISL